VFKRRTRAADPSAERKIEDRDKARTRTMDRAVRLLAAKPRSVRELRERLLEKLWTDEEIVDAVIEKLSHYKYLDDEAFARDTALSKLRQKPQGRRKLQMTMSQKKLDKDIVEKAVADAFESIPEGDLIDRAIQKRLRIKGRPETREDTKKFLDHLLRQGFEYDLIRDRMSSIAEGRFDEDG
jgi:regulatory protein